MDDSVKTALTLMSKAIDEPTSISKDSFIEQLDELIQPRVTRPQSYNDMVELEKMLKVLIHKSDETRIQDVQGRLERERKNIVPQVNDHGNNEEIETKNVRKKSPEGEANKKITSQDNLPSSIAEETQDHSDLEEPKTHEPGIEATGFPPAPTETTNAQKESSEGEANEKVTSQDNLPSSLAEDTQDHSKQEEPNTHGPAIELTNNETLQRDEKNTYLKETTLEQYDEVISRDTYIPKDSTPPLKHFSSKSEYPKFYSDNKDHNHGKHKNTNGSLETIVENPIRDQEQDMSNQQIKPSLKKKDPINKDETGEKKVNAPTKKSEAVVKKPTEQIENTSSSDEKSLTIEKRGFQDGTKGEFQALIIIRVDDPNNKKNEGPKTLEEKPNEEDGNASNEPDYPPRGRAKLICCNII